MDWGALTANECTAFWIGYHTANAERWRERAELKRLDGEDDTSCLEYAQEDDTERERLLSILNKRKEQTKCSAE